MSDPIKDLESFDSQGLPRDPLTPSEVRRRGDRMRRRNNGVVALGAAAAIAVVATSGVFISNAVDRGEEPTPAAPSRTEESAPAAPTEIPDDFPLSAGVSGAQSSDNAAMSGLDYCGTTPLSGLRPVDVRSIAQGGGETSITRTLYLLDSPEASVAAHQEILDAAAACTDGDSKDSGDVEVHRDGEGWPGSTVTEDFGRGASTTEPSVEVVNVVTAGPALLVTSTFGSWSGDVNAGIADTRSTDNKVMVSMADFGEYAAPRADGGSGATPDGSGAGADAAASTIRDDFPLGSGWPDDSVAEPGRNNGLQGPNRTLSDLTFRACGQEWPEPEYADRLRADWNNVEDYRARQLTTYDDADSAAAAVEDLISQQQACPADPVRDDGYVNNREVREVGAADEAWAILERDTLDGADSPFGGSTLVVRVGKAVLVIRGGGHGGYPSGDGQARIDDMMAQAADVISSLCEFAEDGC